MNMCIVHLQIRVDIRMQHFGGSRNNLRACEMGSSSIFDHGGVIPNAGLTSKLSLLESVPEQTRWSVGRLGAIEGLWRFLGSVKMVPMFRGLEWVQDRVYPCRR